MRTTREQLCARLKEVFPVEEGLYGYHVVNEEPIDAQGKMVVRLLVWEEQGGQRSLRDVKEQELFVMEPGYFDSDVPLLEWARGWADAIREVFRRPKPGIVDGLMPHDLGPGDVVRLRRANTAADYTKALLAKSRLGKWLAE